MAPNRSSAGIPPRSSRASWRLARPAFLGRELGEFRLPVAEDVGRNARQGGHLADPKIELVGDDGRRLTPPGPPGPNFVRGRAPRLRDRLHALRPLTPSPAAGSRWRGVACPA